MRYDTENPWMASLFTHWASMSEDAMKTWRKAMGDVRRRRYTPGRMFSDALGLWMGSVEACWSLGYGAWSQPRRVLFVIAPDTEGDQKQEVFMEVPGRNNPDITEFTVNWTAKPGTPDAHTDYKMLTSKDNVKLATTPERDTLTVALCDLAKSAPKPVPAPPGPAPVVPPGPGPVPPPPVAKDMKLYRAAYEGLIYVDEEPLAVLHVVVR